ncbi:MAG TPA: DUF2059 domain-containing protein [Candidatus Acidoferrum sp.]|jgi:hypothetical protein
MKRIAVLIILILGLAGYCRAQQTSADAPASKEDIQKYLEVMHSKDMMAQMAGAMSKPMHQMIHEQYLKNQDKLPPDFEKRLNKVMDDFMATVPWDQMLDNMVPVYQKHLTKGDVDALTAFYSTPTGQKILKELPQITAEAMQNIMPLMQKSMESMNQRLQQETDAMLKESENKRSAQPNN